MRSTLCACNFRLCGPSYSRCFYSPTQRGPKLRGSRSAPPRFKGSLKNRSSRNKDVGTFQTTAPAMPTWNLPRCIWRELGSIWMPICRRVWALSCSEDALARALPRILLSRATRSDKARQTLMLDDIRIDHVEDPATADALGLLQQAAPQMLPHAVSVDVLAAAHGNPISAAGFPVSVARFQIVSTTTSPAGLVVDFVFALTAP